MDRDNITLVAGARRPDAEAPRFESGFWARLAFAQDSASFTASWLDIQCHQLDGVLRSVVVLRVSESGGFAPAAALSFWDPLDVLASLAADLEM